MVYLLSFLLVALVSGNNLSSCTGAIISGRIVGRGTGIAIAALGYMFGFIMEGGLLKAGLLALMPIQSEYLVILALLVALVVFAIAHLTRVPESLSITFTMAIIGIQLGYGFAVNTNFVSYVVLFWIASAALSGLLAIIAMRAALRLTPGWNVWRSVGRIKLLLILVSFLTAFTLGANTIGFIFAATSSLVNPAYGILLTLAAIACGSVFLSSGELKRIGTEIIPMRYLNALVSQTISIVMVQVGTGFSIPTSNIQTFTASVYGAGLSYKTRLLLKKPVFTIIFSWIATAMLSLLLGFLVTYAIYNL